LPWSKDYGEQTLRATYVVATAFSASMVLIVFAGGAELLPTALAFTLGFALLLLTLLTLSVSYVEVSKRGILVVNGYIAKRATFIPKQEVVRVECSPTPRWASLLGPFKSSETAFTVKVVARDGRRAVFTLQLSDLEEFTRIVKEELKVKLDCTSE
jgi:hypothetical protein